MSEKKSALIIANFAYDDPDLRQLVAPAQDAESLAGVLRDPTIGGFDEVQTLLNRPSSEVRQTMEEFFVFADHRRDDLLLLYFSGHGIKDDDGQLYFATADTRLIRHKPLRATAVGANFVKEVLGSSISRRQVLLLDCCYSGAFARALMAKGDKSIGLKEQFEEGRGLVVLTASDSLQYSLEGGDVEGTGVQSVFTRALVEGLQTGEADRDGDGLISLDELYEYVHGQVRDQTPQQRPRKWDLDVEGKIFIARNPRPVAAKLSRELQESIEDGRHWVRLGAVKELEGLLRSKHKGLVLAAEEALAFLAREDFDLRVRSSAENCLASHAEAQRLTEEEPARQEIEAKRRALETAEVAARPTEEQKLASEKAAQEERERQRAEEARLAAERVAAAEKERLAREEQERRQREKAEADRVARERAEAAERERLARERAEQEQIEREKAEAERRVASTVSAVARNLVFVIQQGVQERKFEDRTGERAEAAEKERLAAEKADQERLERDKAEAERLATAEQEQLAREKERAEQARLERERAEAAQQAEQKAAAERVAEQERFDRWRRAFGSAGEKAEADRRASEKVGRGDRLLPYEQHFLAEQERLARERTNEDWANEIRYDVLVRSPQIRQFLARQAPLAKRAMTGEDLLAHLDRIAKLPGVRPKRNFKRYFAETIAKVGYKTGKTREEQLSAPAGKVLVAVLYSMSRRGQHLRSVQQAEDACLLEASVPADLLITYEWDLLVSVRRGSSGTRVEAVTNIPGAIVDWGKSNRCLQNLFDDLRSASLLV